METRFRLSSPSASRSSTDRRAAAALLAAAVALCPGCGDDDGGDDGDDVADAGSDSGGELCGPGDAPADGIVIDPGDGGDSQVVFGQLRSSANNDCPPPGGGGPTSITIQGGQTDPAAPDTFLTLCLPRPDLIEADPIPLADEERVQLIDLLAAPGDGCTLDIDRDGAAAGEVTFSGFCDDGVNDAGYALGFAATVPLLRTCGEEPPAPVEAELSGTVAVTAGSL
jgi:hypothetical protein